MKHLSKLAFLLTLLMVASAHAQLYKWVGADGKITYSDTPPPASAARVETKSLTINGINTADFPFELSETMKLNPVTLYTMANCIPCDDGRRLLIERGVPFNEKTVNSNEDAIQFRKITGADAQLPFLTIGRHKEQGFSASVWNTALTSAGYPETSRLPKSYRHPPAEAAAPKPAPVNPVSAAPKDKAVVKPNSGELPPPVGNAPPGFRF